MHYALQLQTSPSVYGKSEGLGEWVRQWPLLHNQVESDFTVLLMNLVDHLVEIGFPWVCEQRNVHIARARPLSAEEKRVLQGYYNQQILDTVRVRAVECIQNPWFYEELRASGIPTLDISGAAGIAFIDCVVVRKNFQQGSPSWNSVLFHELVHVTQLETLGVRRYLQLYLRDWIENGYQHHNVSLEIQARELEGRFNRHEPLFVVREIVESELRDRM